MPLYQLHFSCFLLHSVNILCIFSNFVQFVLENTVFNQIYYCSKSSFSNSYHSFVFYFILIIYYLYILSLYGFTFLVHQIAIPQHIFLSLLLLPEAMVTIPVFYCVYNCMLFFPVDFLIMALQCK